MDHWGTVCLKNGVGGFRGGSSGSRSSGREWNLKGAHRTCGSSGSSGSKERRDKGLPFPSDERFLLSCFPCDMNWLLKFYVRELHAIFVLEYGLCCDVHTMECTLRCCRVPLERVKDHCVVGGVYISSDLVFSDTLLNERFEKALCHSAHFCSCSVDGVRAVDSSLNLGY